MNILMTTGSNKLGAAKKSGERRNKKEGKDKANFLHVKVSKLKKSKTKQKPIFSFFGTPPRKN